MADSVMILEDVIIIIVINSKFRISVPTAYT